MLPVEGAIRASQQPRVTVGLVTWNSAGYLASCLAGIERQLYPNLDLVVVDNASQDESLSLVRRLAPEAQLIENQENLGYCRAQNQAIGASQAPYFLPLNPDVTLDPGYVAGLVAALESRPDFGSAVGKIWLQGEQAPRHLDGTGLFIDRRRHQYLRGHGQADEGQFDQPGEVFGADGAAPLYRRQMLEDLRLFGKVFDEAFFAYMEDVDLAWRARLFGWRAWYEPAATAVHDRSFRPGKRRQMPPELRRLAVKNRYLMLLKNEGGPTWRRDWWRILSYDLRILGYILLAERSSLGAFRLLRGQVQTARQWRRAIQARLQAGEEDRLRWFE